jgi:hypothetical protein
MLCEINDSDLSLSISHDYEGGFRILSCDLLEREREREQASFPITHMQKQILMIHHSQIGEEDDDGGMSDGPRPLC